MKKLLLTAMVLTGGLVASQAGINISIGLPLPPLPAPPRVIITPPPVVCPPPVYVVPARPPRVVVPCGPGQYHPNHRHGSHRDHYRHPGRGPGHRR